MPTPTSDDAGRDDRVSPRPPADIRARIRAVESTMSQAEARVARLVAEIPDRVAYLTIGELAAEAGASTATVVRAARSLGFSGYPALRLALAEESGRTAATPPTGLDSLGADIRADETTAGILAKLAAFEAEQVTATADLVDPDELEAVIGAVAKARRISLYGIGASGLVAQDLTQKLSRIGLACTAHLEHDSALVNAALLTGDDVAIAISHSGENPGAVAPLALAAQNGVTTVAITGAPRSTVARTARHVLLTAGREFGLRSAAMASRSSQLFVIDALFVGVAYRVPDARRALQLTYDAVRSHTAH